LALLVDGKSVDPETDKPSADGGQSFLVNVSRTKKSDEPFSILVQFRVPMSRLKQMGGRLELHIPTIGDPDAPGVVLQQLRTAVWVPDEVAVVGLPDNFERENPPSLLNLLRRLFGIAPHAAAQEELESWIGVPAAGIIDFPTEGHLYLYSNLGGDKALAVTWWDIAAYTWILSSVLFVVAWVLRKTSWENKLGLLLLIAFVAALLAIRDADWVLHGLIAASYGLLAMVVLWLIHALVGPPRLQPAGAFPVQPTVPAVIPPPGTFDDEHAETGAGTEAAESESADQADDEASESGDTT
jgi:hypothetical protein